MRTRSAAGVFYLAVYALLGTTVAASHSKDATKSRNVAPNVCAVRNSTTSASPAATKGSTTRPNTFSMQFEPGAIVSDACASYEALETLNEDLYPYIHTITQDTDFFSYYRLNLYNKVCPFWSDEDGMCGNRACAVDTLENEEDIPLVWRTTELGKLEGPKAQHPGKKQRSERQATRPLVGELGDIGESCVVEYDDECDERDYCIPDDEGATAKGDYVSLVDNPERFTGYSGPSAHQVWEAIYRENCFSKPAAATAGGSKGFQAQASQDLRNVLQQQNLQRSVQSAIAQGTAAPLVDAEAEDECLEKRVFYRVVSGMHASISTHLCWDYLNQTTGQWGPNLSCYDDRLHNHPERISNLYFNYALLLRAVGKVRQHIRDYQFCTEEPEQNQRTKALVLSLSKQIPAGPEIFDESVMFREASGGVALKEDFRNRFRNVSRIMDCVGCDKCRLWGKLQTNGYGTALKVLFEFDEKDDANNPPLRRTELVALINTLDKVSSAIRAIKEFRGLRDRRAAGDSVDPNSARLPPTPQPRIIEIDDYDDEPAAPSPRTASNNRTMPAQHETTIMEDFYEELDNVWRAYIFVLKQWMGLPYKLWSIAILEADRLWDYWLGLPVKPRQWGFSFGVPPPEHRRGEL